MHIQRIAVAAAVFSLALTGQPQAKPALNPQPGMPARPYLADVRSWVMTAVASHRKYQISVALPEGYTAGHAPYPVLYVTDANAEFGLAVEMARPAVDLCRRARAVRRRQERRQHAPET